MVTVTVTVTVLSLCSPKTHTLTHYAYSSAHHAYSSAHYAYSSAHHAYPSAHYAYPSAHYAYQIKKTTLLLNCCAQRLSWRGSKTEKWELLLQSYIGKLVLKLCDSREFNHIGAIHVR